MNSKTNAIGLESQMESRNKGKCLKNEKKEKRKKKGLYTFMIIIDQNSALLQDYARVEQFVKCSRDIDTENSIYYNMC